MSGTAEPPGRHVRRGALALVVTLAVVALIAVPLLLSGGSPAGSPPTPPTVAASQSVPPSAAAATTTTASASPVPPAATTRAVASPGPGRAELVDGATVEATGRIVSVPGKPLRLCAPESSPAIGYAPGHEPAPAWCPIGVDVTGVNLQTLQFTRSKNGATEGYGYVRGVYRSGTVAVSAQSGQRTSAPTYSNLVTPPCPMPPGGWHRETRGSNPVMSDEVTAYVGGHPGQVTAVSIFRPNGTSGVVVAAVKDLAAARAALPADPASLCLIASKYTTALVAAAQVPFVADQTAHSTSAGGVISVAQSVGPDGQSVVDVAVVAVTPQVVKWAGDAPAGLVTIIPWLSTVAADAPMPALLPTGEPTVSPASASLYASEDAAYPSAPRSSLG